MANDKIGQREGRVTTMAIANMVAAIVDTDVSNDIVHLFLDKLDR